METFNPTSDLKMMAMKPGVCNICLFCCSDVSAAAMAHASISICSFFRTNNFLVGSSTVAFCKDFSCYDYVQLSLKIYMYVKFWALRYEIAVEYFMKSGFQQFIIPLLLLDVYEELKTTIFGFYCPVYTCMNI